MLRAGRAARAADRAHHHRDGEGAAGDLATFAAWLTSWSDASVRKSKNMISTTGRSPVIAAPIASADEDALADRRVADAYWPKRRAGPRVAT